MHIKTESFTARHIINFYLPAPLTAENTCVVTVLSSKTASSPVQNILQIDGITRCLIADTLLAVKYAETADLSDIIALVMAEIDDYFAALNTLIADESNVSLLEQAEAVADSLIRPTLYRDNGGINIESIVDGVILMQFTGHCAGCPYAQNTLNNVVGKVFKKYLPQITAIKIKE